MKSGTIVAAVALALACSASADAARQQQTTPADAESKRGVPAPRLPQRAGEFDTGVRDVTAQLSRRQFEAAIRKLDQLRAANAAEYDQAGLAARRDEAVKGLAGQVADEARDLIKKRRLIDAAARLRQTDQSVSAQKPVADLLAEIKKREDDYQRLKNDAREALSAGSYSSARDKFDQARATHSEQFDTDKLATWRDTAAKLAYGQPGDRSSEPVLRSPTNDQALDANALESRRVADLAKQLAAQGKYAESEAVYASALRFDANNLEVFEALEKTKRFKTLRDQGLGLLKANDVAAARKVLVEARNVDAARFAREGLAATLAGPVAVPNAGKLALQDGLLALLKGDAEASIALLEPALATGDRSASLHAYLGVAYATRALSAPKPDDRTRLQVKAVEQFRLAASLQPGYRLSDRVVSPAIIRIYEQSR